MQVAVGLMHNCAVEAFRPEAEPERPRKRSGRRKTRIAESIRHANESESNGRVPPRPEGTGLDPAKAR